MSPVAGPHPEIEDPWTRYLMALDAIAERLERITRAFNEAGVPYALVGGQAVALWVASRDPDAVRTTKDVDILLSRSDLPAARKAAQADGWEYFEVMRVGMFLERKDPSPKRGVHLLWAGEKVSEADPLPAPQVHERLELRPGRPVVPIAALLRMKLMADRHHDRAHILDMIGVGLIGRADLTGLPPELAARLDVLLTEAGL